MSTSFLQWTETALGCHDDSGKVVEFFHVFKTCRGVLFKKGFYLSDRCLIAAPAPSFGPLAVKSAVCAGSRHPPTAKPALQADGVVVPSSPTGGRLTTGSHLVPAVMQMLQMFLGLLSGPGQLCRVGSRPVCVSSSCANPCKADRGRSCRHHNAIPEELWLFLLLA